MIKLTNVVLALATLAFVAPTVSDAFAQDKSTKAQKPRKKTGGGLAGSEGDVKRKIMFQSTSEGGCERVYRRYVESGAHAAFAATNIDYFYGDPYVCGADFAASSQAAAERQALAECEAAKVQYKAQNKSMQLSGRCFVYASK